MAGTNPIPSSSSAQNLSSLETAPTESPPEPLPPSVDKKIYGEKQKNQPGDKNRARQLQHQMKLLDSSEQAQLDKDVVLSQREKLYSARDVESFKQALHKLIELGKSPSPADAKQFINHVNTSVFLLSLAEQNANRSAPLFRNEYFAKPPMSTEDVIACLQLIAACQRTANDWQQVTGLIVPFETTLQRKKEWAAIELLVTFCSEGTPSQDDIQDKLKEMNVDFTVDMAQMFCLSMRNASYENRLRGLQALLAHLHGTAIYEQAQEKFKEMVSFLKLQVAQNAA